MSLNSLKIASDGYLKRTTKAALVIAVAGYLNFGGTPVPPIPPSGGGGGGGGWYSESFNKEKEQREEQERIEIEDSEIIAIIELTLKHFII